MHGCSAHLQFPLPLCQYGGPSVAMPKQNRIFGDSNRGMPQCRGFGPIFSSQTLSPGSRKNADDENLQRSSTWINPYQEQFLRKQTSDLGKPGGNGDCLFFENNGGFDISYTGHLDGKTANSTDFPSYHCIVLNVISCLSHSTL